ncbi:MAG: hypothetical protein U9P38_04835 [Campylobacterota bacterium]|nr:hypothetical protein [Campylobacterota bacterium]
MKLFSTIILTLFVASSIEANCNTHYLIGSETQKQGKISQENSIVWDYKDKVWNSSTPKNGLDTTTLKCKDEGYILINNNNLNYNISLKRDAHYKISKGWNYFATPIDGIDMVKSFQNSKDIKFVYVYDKTSKAWAGYSPLKELQEKIISTRILNLKYIEPNRGFYLYASKNMTITTQGTVLNKQCQKIVDKGYSVLIATAVDKKAVFNKTKTLSVKSRYAPHYRQGIYNDTRVALLFDEKKSSQKSSKKPLTYGPAEPAVMISYDESLEDSWFFVFDYFKKECYRGMLPSKKVPPFSTLQKVK